MTKGFRNDIITIVVWRLESCCSETASVSGRPAQTRGSRQELSQIMDEAKEKSDLRIAQRTTLFIAMFASFVFPFSSNSLNIAVPFIGADLQVPATNLTWTMSAMMLTNIALNVPFGRFADLWGKRKVFNIGILIFSVGTFAGAIAPNFWTLIIFRVIQGIGGAMFVSTNIAILLDVYPAQQRGRVLGLSVMCTYIGLSLGPVVGGFIIEYLSWRAVFIITALFTLITFVVAMLSLSKLPKTATARSADIRTDPLSNILYMSAMVLFMYGFTVFGQHVYSYFFLGAGILLLVVFGWHELKTPLPIIELRLFKNNLNYVFSNLSAMLNYMSVGALSYILTIYLVVVKGFPPNIAGFILIAQPVVMAICSPIVGRFSDKRSPFVISSLGMGICTLSMLLFLLLREDSPIILVIINLVILGFGFGVFSSPNMNAVMSSVSPKDYGIANSIINTMRMVGQLSGMAIITIIMYFTIGDALISEVGAAGIMSAFHTTFVVFAFICMAGVLLSLGRRKKP